MSLKNKKKKKGPAHRRRPVTFFLPGDLLVIAARRETSMYHANVLMVPVGADASLGLHRIMNDCTVVPIGSAVVYVSKGDNERCTVLFEGRIGKVLKRFLKKVDP